VASANPTDPAPPSGQTVQLMLAWALVGIPLIWGVLQTLSNALKLFE
jgi:hypothetical protein